MADSIIFHKVVDIGQESIKGTIIRFPGLESSMTDVYVRLTRLDISSPKNSHNEVGISNNLADISFGDFQ